MLLIGGVLAGWLAGWRAHICIRTQKTRNNKRPTFTFTTLLFRRLIVSLPLFSSTAFVLRGTLIHFLPFRKCFIAAVSRLDCAFSPVALLTITFLTELAPVRLFWSLSCFACIWFHSFMRFESEYLYSFDAAFHVWLSRGPAESCILALC